MYEYNDLRIKMDFSKFNDSKINTITTILKFIIIMKIIQIIHYIKNKVVFLNKVI